MKRTPRRKIIKELRGQGITYNQIRRFDYLMKKIEDTMDKISKNYARYGQYRALEPLDLEDVPIFLESGATFDDILRLFGDENRETNEKLKWAQETASYVNNLLGTSTYTAGDFINFDNEEIEALKDIIDELLRYIKLREQEKEGTFWYNVYTDSINRLVDRLNRLIFGAKERGKEG